MMQRFDEHQRAVLMGLGKPSQHAQFLKTHSHLLAECCSTVGTLCEVNYVKERLFGVCESSTCFV